MKIRQVKIQNFRHIDELTLSVDDMVALIGPNNIGKSSILRAIQAFCEPINNIPDADYNEANGYPNIEITITFSDLSEDTKSQYRTRLLDEEKLIIKKKWIKGKAKPEFFSKELCIKDPLLSDIGGNWKELKSDTTWIGLADENEVEFKKKDDVIEFITSYVNNHRDLYKWEEDWIPNPSGLQEILIHHMPEIIFIQGVVDVPEQLTTKQGTIFTKILGLIIEDALETNQNAQEIFIKLNKLISGFSQNPTEGVERINNIIQLENEMAKNMPAGMEAKFIIDAKEIPLSKIIQQVAEIKVDDGTQTPLENKGHGMQRAAIFSLLRTFSALSRNKASNSQEENGSGINHRRPYLFLVEEPELYLHPQAQRQMASSFEDLISEGNQVIFSTHSPSLIDLSQEKRICILYKNKDSKIFKKQLEEELFEEDERNRFKLLEYMNPHRSELFFAKRVVFVEGESDRIVLEMLGDYLNIRKSEISIIETESKDNIPFYIHLAEAFELDYIVIHDEDAREDDISNPPEKEEDECENCFLRKKDKFRSLKDHPKKNNRIKEIIRNGKLLTFYPTLNEEFVIPKGKSKGVSAQQWCEEVRNGEKELPLKLEKIIEEVYLF